MLQEGTRSLMAGMTNALGNSVLTANFTNQAHWLALHSTDPTAAGLAGGEIMGGSYTRQQVNWTAPSARSVANSNSIVYHNLPGVTVNYFALWTAQSGGNCYYVIDLTAIGRAFTTSVGEMLTIPVHDISITLQ